MKDTAASNPFDNDGAYGATKGGGGADVYKADVHKAAAEAPDPHHGVVLQQEHPNLHEYVAKARQVSMFSIGFTTVCAAVGLTFAFRTKSSALFGYSLEAIVDVWSSVLVLYRFWYDPDGEGAYFEVTRRRETRASVGIAFTFVLASIATASQAIYHLSRHTPPAQSVVLLAISSTSILILTWSCIVKLHLARVLQSTALRKDAVTSGACGLMAAAILVSTSIHKAHPSVWWLDATIALVISAILGVLGVRTLLRKAWWRRDFWVDSDLADEERDMTTTAVQLTRFDGDEGVLAGTGPLTSGIASSTGPDKPTFKGPTAFRVQA